MFLLQINSLSTMLNGPEYLVAAGLEQFINMSMDYANPNPSRAQTRMRSQQFGSRLSIQSRLQSRKERLARTSKRISSFLQNLYEPRREKTHLRDLRPGPTQTRLYIHRRWLEGGNFGFRK